MLVPAKTPAGITAKLNGEVVRILRLPEVRAQLESLSFEVIGSTPEEYTRFAKADLARWAKTLKEAGIKPE
jgi:tripartite-type tricarboxylate transporter receptor subunit TctC